MAEKSLEIRCETGKKKTVFIPSDCLQHLERWHKCPTGQPRTDDAKANVLWKSTCSQSSVYQKVAQLNEILNLWADSITQSNLEGVWGPSIPVRGIQRIQTWEWGHVGRVTGPLRLTWWVMALTHNAERESCKTEAQRKRRSDSKLVLVLKTVINLI